MTEAKCPYMFSLIREYLEFVQMAYLTWPENHKGLFFRGHADEKWQLLPSSMRKDIRGVFPSEKELILDFRRVSVTEVDSRLKVENMLVEMKHYGLPTRMLDWTISPLNALYFACQDSYGDRMGANTDGLVCALNPWEDYRRIKVRLMPHPELIDILKEARLLLAKGWSYEKIRIFIERKYDYVISGDTLRVPVPFVGRYIVDSAVTSRNCYVLWGDGDNHYYSPSLYTSLEKFSEYDGCMLQFRIPYEKKAALLTILRQLGVDNFTIFPDRSGVRKEIAETGSLFNYR